MTGRKVAKRKMRVELASGKSITIKVVGHGKRKAVTVLRESVASTVVRCICLVLSGPMGGQCDLSLSPEKAGLQLTRWATTLRQIATEICKTYPKLKITKGDVKEWYGKPLEALANALVSRIK